MNSQSSGGREVIIFGWIYDTPLTILPGTEIEVEEEKKKVRFLHERVKILLSVLQNSKEIFAKMGASRR